MYLGTGKTISISLILIFSISLFYPLANSGVFDSQVQVMNTVGAALSQEQNSTILDAFADGSNLITFEEDEVIDGLNLITLGSYQNSGNQEDMNGYLVIFDMQGEIVNSIYVPGGVPESTNLLNATTAYFGEPASGQIMLWNFLTNDTQLLPVPMGHDDIDYNPETRTFMVIERVQIDEIMFEDELHPVVSDDIVEYHVSGVERWRWHVNSSFPFDIDEYYLRNETLGESLDWTHVNSLYWDVDNAELFINIRNLDCLVKISHILREPIWAVGRYTGEVNAYTLLDESSNTVESLFYHASEFEMIGDNRFIIFDGDYWNQSNEMSDGGLIQFIEFSVNEIEMSAKIQSRRSTTQKSSLQGSIGFIPGNHTVGSLQSAVEPVIVEVNQAGEIVWEWALNQTEELAWIMPIGGLTRFYPEPVIMSLEYPTTLVEGEFFTVTFQLWDSIHRSYEHDVSVSLLEGGFAFAEDSIDLKPMWQSNLIELETSTLTAGEHTIALIVQNDEEQSCVVLLNIIVEVNYIVLGGITLVVAVVIVLGVYMFRKPRAKE